VNTQSSRLLGLSRLALSKACLESCKLNATTPQSATSAKAPGIPQRSGAASRRDVARNQPPRANRIVCFRRSIDI